MRWRVRRRVRIRVLSAIADVWLVALIFWVGGDNRWWMGPVAVLWVVRAWGAERAAAR